MTDYFKYVFILILVLITGFLFPFSAALCAAAAPVDSYEILLRSGRFTPDPGISRAVAESLESRGRAALGRGKNRVHTIIQLEEIPTAARRRALAREGIRLLTYIPNYAWLASIPAGAPGKVLKARGVRWIGDLRTGDKLQPELRAGRPGAWAFDEKSGRMAVLVQLFRDVDLAEGREVVEAHGGKVVGSASVINTLVVHIKKDKIEGLAGEDIVEWIEQPIPPLVAINAENRAIVGADTLQIVPYNLDGGGVDVLVYDGGRAYNHNDLDSHMTYGDSAPLSEHATHVSCTVCGNGTVTYNNRGMAPAANLLSMGNEDDGSGVFLYTNPGDIQNDFDYAKNTWAPSADLLNASIGTNTARNGFPCSYEGNYGATSQLLDSIVGGSLGDTFIMAWANGNERGYETCGTTYNTTAPPACAKNPIQSGATDEADNMSSFSSWGPTDDGRVKPVICAPGVNVLSCNSTNSYTTMNGTSMASPTTAGIIALMLEQYRTTYATAGEFLPSSAKALLIHTAVDLGNTGPDYQFGYGRIDGVGAVDTIISRDLREETLSAQGEVHDYQITVSGGTSELKASLAWDDPAGTLMAIKKLVNDLDLELIAPDMTVHYPWILNPDIPAATATTGVDDLNNQEQVIVSSPAAGSWTIRVKASILANFPQDYSIVFPGAYSIDPTPTPGLTPTATATPDYCAGALANGAFEDGDAHWTWSGSASRSSTYAHGGTYSARVGGMANGSLYQEIDVPSAATEATLTYWVRMETDEGEWGHPWDFLDVEIKDESGETLTTLQSLCDGDSSYDGVWTQETFILSSEYAGRTIRTYFQADVDNSVDTYWYIDDVGLEVCAYGPSPTPTATNTPTSTPTITMTPTQTPTPTITPTITPTWPYFGKDEVPDKAIPDNDTAGVRSYLFMTENYQIDDLNVFVDITHDWIGDLIVEVTSPDSTTVRLHNRSGGSSSDINTWYDRETDPDGPGKMNNFNTKQTYGTWQLWVSDNDLNNIGTLNRWGLEFLGTPIPTPTPAAKLAIMRKEDVSDVNLYYYTGPAAGDWTYWDAIARNPSALARDLWVIPWGNDAVDISAAGLTGVSGDSLCVVKKEAGNDMNLYVYNGLALFDYNYQDAAARNPSPLAMDLWIIPSGNHITATSRLDMEAGGNDELAVMKIQGINDFNLFYYNSPAAGDWTYTDAIARNPSPLALDLWVIPSGNDVLGMAAADIDGDGSRELVVLKREGGADINLYCYNNLVPGDLTYLDAIYRNPSPLARDLWMIPFQNDAVAIAALDVGSGGVEELVVMKKEGGVDVNLYCYNGPAAGDWTYWDAVSRNPSPLARDFWVIPSGNDPVGLTGIGME